MTIDVPEKFVVHVQKSAAQFRNLSEDQAIHELSLMKPFEWICDEDSRTHSFYYKIELKYSDGRRFSFILTANVSLNMTASPLSHAEYGWDVSRSVSQDPSPVEPEPKSGFFTKAVGSGRADSLASAKVICESVTLAYIRGWEPDIDRPFRPILPTLVMPVEPNS